MPNGRLMMGHLWQEMTPECVGERATELLCSDQEEKLDGPAFVDILRARRKGIRARSVLVLSNHQLTGLGGMLLLHRWVRAQSAYFETFLTAGTILITLDMTSLAVEASSPYLGTADADWGIGSRHSTS